MLCFCSVTASFITPILQKRTVWLREEVIIVHGLLVSAGVSGGALGRVLPPGSCGEPTLESSPIFLPPSPSLTDIPHIPVGSELGDLLSFYNQCWLRILLTHRTPFGSHSLPRDSQGSNPAQGPPGEYQPRSPGIGITQSFCNQRLSDSTAACPTVHPIARGL